MGAAYVLVYLVTSHSKSLVPTCQSCPSFMACTPSQLCQVPQATLINPTMPDHASRFPFIASWMGARNIIGTYPHSLQGCCCLQRSCDHHVTIMQPHVTHTTLSAGQLAIGPGT